MRTSLNIDKTYKILILDDSVNQLKLLADCLENSLEYEVLQAKDTETAFRILKDKKPDLVVTDWDMPEMDGIEFIKKLKQSPDWEHIPVIMATSKMVTNEHLKTALSAGALDYIRSPFDCVELKARVRSMLELSLGYQKIKELNNLKDQLLSLLSHDLKNPFNSMLGFTELLIDEWDIIKDNRKIEIIKDLNNVTSRTFDLLKEILEWSDSQRKTYRFAPFEFSINNLIRDVVKQQEVQAKVKSINIRFNPNSESYVYADINTIKTVLRNLLGNAIKFTHEGGQVFFEVEAQSNNILVSVADNGIGINSQIKDEIFKIGKQKIQLGTANEKGTGFGLVLCKDYVERNGGKIWFESEQGKGTVFFFTIPTVKLD